MPRSFTQGFRSGLEASSSDEQIVMLVEIYHSQMPEPVRLANDTVDYVRVGDIRYIGFPFVLEVITDGDRPPRGSFTVQNVDARIGSLIRAMTEAPNFQIELFSTHDFGDAVLGTRTEVGTATVQYSALNLQLRNFEVNAATVSADIVSFDLTSEPWPAIRSTVDRLPGLEP